MTKEQYLKLSQIYSALYQVNTCGENTKIMGKVLEALEALLIEGKNEEV